MLLPFHGGEVMKECTIKQIIQILSSSGKSGYCLEFENKSFKFAYKINISGSDSISVNVTSKDNDFNMDYLVNDVNDLPATESKPLSISEYKWTAQGSLVEESKSFLYRELELFLKVFKSLKDQAMFLIQNDKETKICYYVNTRVFYVEERLDVYELHELSLFKLYSIMNRPKIVSVGPLPKKYTYRSFFTEHNQIATDSGKKFLNLKEGVGVRC